MSARGLICKMKKTKNPPFTINEDNVRRWAIVNISNYKITNKENIYLFIRKGLDFFGIVHKGGNRAFDQVEQGSTSYRKPFSMVVNVIYRVVKLYLFIFHAKNINTLQKKSYWQYYSSSMDLLNKMYNLGNMILLMAPGFKDYEKRYEIWKDFLEKNYG